MFPGLYGHFPLMNGAHRSARLFPHRRQPHRNTAVGVQCTIRQKELEIMQRNDGTLIYYRHNCFDDVRPMVR